MDRHRLTGVRRRQWVTAAAVMLASVTMGCSGSGSTGGITGGPSDISFAAMLRLVPDTTNTRAQVIVNRFDPAWKASGLDRNATGQQLDRVALTFSGSLGKVRVAPSRLFSTPSVPLSQWRDRVGYDPTKITADIEAGQPPHVLSAARGDFDLERITSALRKTIGEQVKTTTIGGTEVVRWLGDEQADVDLKIPFSQAGGAGRVAAPADGTLVLAPHRRRPAVSGRRRQRRHQDAGR